MFNNNHFTKEKIIKAILIIMILYFSFFFLFGRYGFIQYTQLKREEDIKNMELSKIEAINNNLDKKINSLNSAKIDKDLLDEQVRKNLGYVGEKETIIFYE